jgi:hypothetical protein
MKYLTLLVVLLCGCANYTAMPMMKYGHTSALTRGKPWNDTDEHTLDRIEAGVTIRPTYSDKVEVDITHGRKYWDGNDEQSTSLDVRWYPWGQR